MRARDPTHSNDHPTNISMSYSIAPRGVSTFPTWPSQSPAHDSCVPNHGMLCQVQLLCHQVGLFVELLIAAVYSFTYCNSVHLLGYDSRMERARRSHRRH